MPKSSHFKVLKLTSYFSGGTPFHPQPWTFASYKTHTNPAAPCLPLYPAPQSMVYHRDPAAWTSPPCATHPAYSLSASPGGSQQLKDLGLDLTSATFVLLEEGLQFPQTKCSPEFLQIFKQRSNSVAVLELPASGHSSCTNSFHLCWLWMLKGYSYPL